jgi:hypothetical protein
MNGHGDQADRLLLGFEFADGRRCTNLQDPRAEGIVHGVEEPKGSHPA